MFASLNEVRAHIEAGLAPVLHPEVSGEGEFYQIELAALATREIELEDEIDALRIEIEQVKIRNAGVSQRNEATRSAWVRDGAIRRASAEYLAASAALAQAAADRAHYEVRTEALRTQMLAAPASSSERAERGAALNELKLEREGISTRISESKTALATLDPERVPENLIEAPEPVPTTHQLEYELGETRARIKALVGMRESMRARNSSPELEALSEAAQLLEVRLRGIEEAAAGVVAAAAALEKARVAAFKAANLPEITTLRGESGCWRESPAGVASEIVAQRAGESLSALGGLVSPQTGGCCC